MSRGTDSPVAVEVEEDAPTGGADADGTVSEPTMVAPAGPLPSERVEAPSCSRPGTAGMELSEQSGMGEDSMMAFVHGYMKRILQPFADNVEELHKHVEVLAAGLDATAGKTKANADTLECHAEIVVELRSGLGSTSELAKKLEKLLDCTVEEKAALHADHELTKSRVAGLDERLCTGESKIQELQDKSKDTRCKLSKLREEHAETDRGIAQRVHPALERLDAGLSALDGRHEATSQSLADFKANALEELQALQAGTRAHGERLDGSDAWMGKAEDRLHRLDEALVDAQRHLQFRLEQIQVHDAAIELLKGRCKKSEGALNELQEQQHRADVRITDHDVRFHKVESQTDEITAWMNQMRCQRDPNKFMDALAAELAEHRQRLDSLDETAKHHSKQVTLNTDRLDVAEGIQDNLQGRAKRLERKVGLEPYRKNAPLEAEVEENKPTSKFSEKQLKGFRSAFESFDRDGSGSVTARELGLVMEGLGHKPTAEMLDDMIDEVDKDGSGEIEFDEFCTLMAGVTGDDGDFDPAKAAEKAVASLSLLARQKQAFETIDTHTRSLRVDEEDIRVLKENAAAFAERRCGYLEETLAATVDDVRKLRQNMDLTQEYWKGLSRGLKETKRTVAPHAGEEGMPMPMLLPTPRKGGGTTTLPAIAPGLQPGRPGTGAGGSGSMTAR